MPINLKEALCVIKGGKYQFATPSDRLVIQKFVDPDAFLDKFKVLYDDANWLRCKKFLRIIKILQLLIGSLMLAYIFFFVAAMFVSLSPGKLDTYEFLYLGFCGLLILFFILLLYTMYIEARVLRGCRPAIMKKFSESIQEAFTECSFMVNVDRSLTIRTRPLMLSEDEDAHYDENIDYYDFINYNNPEDEDYYNKQNPYELDPHEKNVMAEMVSKREKEIEREAKKGQRFKFFGKQNKE